MSSRVTGTLLRDALAQSQKQIVYGEVSLDQPAPASFTDPLSVVIPDWSTDFYHTVQPGNWFACHGSTLPQPGAACLLIYDNQGTLTCPLWASATTSFAATSISAISWGGVLSGTGPNPGFAASALTSLGIARGAGSFSGNSASNILVTVTHGLAGTPTVYGATPVFEGCVKAISASSTTFTVQFDLFNAAGAPGSAVTFSSFGSSTWQYLWFACL